MAAGGVKGYREHVWILIPLIVFLGSKEANIIQKKKINWNNKTCQENIILLGERLGPRDQKETRKKPSIQDQVQTVSFKQNTDNNKKIASF